MSDSRDHARQTREDFNVGELVREALAHGAVTIVPLDDFGDYRVSLRRGKQRINTKGTLAKALHMAALEADRRDVEEREASYFKGRGS